MALRRAKLSTQQKHQKFVEEYVRTLNATQAALACGCPKDSARQRGYEMLHMSDISLQIETLLAQRSEQCGVDTQWVIEQAKDMVLDTKAPLRDRVKALDLIGRYTKAWSGETDTKSTTTIEVRLSD